MMSNYSKKQEEKNENKEKNKTRREKLATYFFDLSKLVFAALVLGGITPLFTNTANKINWATIVLGVFSTYIFANFANRILK
jgi:hypothetical protein